MESALYGIYALVFVSENERVSFLIQKRERKYRAKHFPCCNLFISYLLRFFNPNQIFTLH